MGRGIAKYGSIDPCYPSKVSQAHIHNLIFKKHAKHKLDFIFFPCITHMPTFVAGTQDSTSCPIVAGAPKVMRAAFTKEIDFFARAGIEYVDDAVTLQEPNYFARQMFETWGRRLGITEDESDHACREGMKALGLFDSEMERRGLELLEQLEEEHKVGVLLLGRPYHLDPGLHHGVPDEYQALGYPILTIRSIPKDPKWLARFFKDDLDSSFHHDATLGAGRVAGKLLHEQRPESVGGQVRGTPSEHRRARSLELQVRP